MADEQPQEELIKLLEQYKASDNACRKIHIICADQGIMPGHVIDRVLELAESHTKLVEDTRFLVRDLSSKLGSAMDEAELKMGHRPISDELKVMRSILSGLQAFVLKQPKLKP